MLTVIEGEGQVFVGVSLSELFLAFGSYFRAITWYYSSHFHRRLHKLMVAYIWRDYPPCRAFFPAGGGFSFLVSFHLTLQSAHSSDKQGCTFPLHLKVVWSDKKALHKNCILGYQEHKVWVLLERFLRCPRGFLRGKPPYPPILLRSLTLL